MISGTDHLETVLYETGNRVAKIALNRPKALNASNAQLRRELLAVLETAAADDDVRIVILTGMGRAFCSGADLEEIHNMPGEQIQAQINIEYKPILLAITQMPKLVISALNGAAVGVGAGLAMAADLTIMAQDAFIYFAFSTIGLVPDGGASWQLVQTLGYKQALQLIVEGAELSAGKCLELGLVNKIASADCLMDDAQKWAESLANGAPLAQQLSKQVLKESMSLEFADVVSLEARYQKKCFDSKDFREGVKAFLTKRSPVLKVSKFEKA